MTRTQAHLLDLSCVFVATGPPATFRFKFTSETIHPQLPEPLPLTNCRGLQYLKGMSVPIYAARTYDGPYHVVEPRGDLTLCGLKVSRITEGTGRAVLHVVKEKPRQGRLCKHCERLATTAELEKS